jgi:transposase
LSAVRWAKNHSVAEVLGLDEIQKKGLYEALDWLVQRQDQIEKKLFRSYTRKKGGPNVLVLYDVTSCYLEGEHNELGAHGYCRDKKKGKKQIVVGLLTAADGEPLSIKVFEGNTSDPTTVTDQIDVLKKRFGVEDVVFVGDRGMIKKKGKEELGREGLKYITALTNPQIRKLLREGVLQPGLFDQTMCEVTCGVLRLILRRNERVREKESKRRENKLARLSQLVEKRNSFMEESKRALPEAGLTKLTKWASHHKISSFASLSLDERKIVVKIDKEAKSDAARLDGCYVLETDVSLHKMDAKTIDERYRSLQRVERDFRTLKTAFLEVRPIFVRKADRTRAHAFVAMLALKIVREGERMVKKASASGELPEFIINFQDALDTLARLCFQRHKIKDIEFLRLPCTDESQSAVLSALKINPPRNKTSMPLLAEAS